MALKDWEAVHIVEAVRRNHGNRAAAARELGINPSTLFRKVKALGVKLPGRDDHRYLNLTLLRAMNLASAQARTRPAVLTSDLSRNRGGSLDRSQARISRFSPHLTG